jgi:hypothetical protein
MDLRVAEILAAQVEAALRAPAAAVESNEAAAPAAPAAAEIRS